MAHPSRRMPPPQPAGADRRRRTPQIFAPARRAAGGRRSASAGEGLRRAVGASRRARRVRQRGADRPPLPRGCRVARRAAALAAAITMRRSSPGSRRPPALCKSSSPPNRAAQYRFQSVELPGLDAAGEEAASLREAFAVRAGDPVIAEDVIAAGTELQVALGEAGLRDSPRSASSTRDRSRNAHRQPGAAGRAGPGRSVRRRSGRAATRRSRRSHIATIARFEHGRRSSSGRKSTICAAP